MGKIVTFGEVMARLTPDDCLRLRQALPGHLNVTFAGAEANVAASLAYCGKDVTFVSALPNHAIADACIASLKALGINTDYIVRSPKGRLGLYFLETGANQRPSQVIYDRDYSTFSLTESQLYDWNQILDGASWLHITGITPSVSQMASQNTLMLVNIAKHKGLRISCDLNFRKKLWKWDSTCSPADLAEKVMRQIIPFVDVLIGNEEDAADVLKIRAGRTDVGSGALEIDKYPSVAKQIISQFPNISHVAITLRQSISASHNNWGAMLYEANNTVYFEPSDGSKYKPYEIKNIVDRVGGGDAFAAGLIFALNTPELSNAQTALSFAVAASCLAHSIQGDINFSTRAEVERLMKGNASGRVVR
jgi:2-dehydro-3-deoxygluconokinase